MWDKSFCAKYKNNVTHAIFDTKATVSSTVTIFDKMACVVISIIKYRIWCKNKEDPLGKPPTLDECPVDDPYCSRPLRILETVRNVWWSQDVDYDTHDAVLFLSGYDDGTTVVGAAYVGGVCSSYRFAWVEELNYAVIGHEMGHLLGAQHSPTGLMKKTIVLSEKPLLSKFSAQSIWNYVKKESNGWCLSRDSPRRTAQSIVRNFTILETGDLIPINFDLYFNRGFDGVRFMMVLRNKTDDGGPLNYFAFTRLSLSGEKITEDTKFWNNTDIPYGPFVLPIEQPGRIACADVTLSHVGKPIVMTVRQLGNNLRPFYQVAQDNGKAAITKPKKWTRAKFIPVSMNGMRVQSCAIEATNTQFLFAFARASGKNKALIFYTAGRQMSWDGTVQNGWTGLIRVPVVVPGLVTSLGVSIFKVVTDAEADVIFSYIYKDWKGVSHMRIIVGFGLNADGTVSGGWTGVVDYIPSVDNSTRASVGYGIDVSPRDLYNAKSKKIERLRLPTLAFVDTVEERDSYRVVLQHEALANGMFNRANVTENAELVPACEKCYSDFKAGKCVTFRLSCSEANSYPIDYAFTEGASQSDLNEFNLVRALQQQSSRQSTDTAGNKSYPGYPDTINKGGEVFCAGVFKLFIAKTGGDCAGKVSNMWIATAGLAQLIEASLPDFVAADEKVDADSVDILVQFDVDGETSEDNLDGGFADNVRNKGPSNIQVYYWKKLRFIAIRNALKDVLKAKDYSYWFQNKKPPTIKVVPIKRGKYKFLHTISFPWFDFS